MVKNNCKGKALLKSLQSTVKELNMALSLDPPIDISDNPEHLVAEIRGVAPEIRENDELSNTTVAVLNEIGVGPWAKKEEKAEEKPKKVAGKKAAKKEEEPQEEEPQEEEPQEEEPQEEEPEKKEAKVSKKTAAPKKTESKKPEKKVEAKSSAEKDEFGFRPGCKKSKCMADIKAGKFTKDQLHKKYGGQLFFAIKEAKERAGKDVRENKKGMMVIA